MRTQEVVAAVIDSTCFTDEPQKIDASSALGRRVRFITRHEAQKQAAYASGGVWNHFANGPCLFLIENGARFRAVT